MILPTPSSTPGLDGLAGPAREHLLGGLEQQPHRAGQHPLTVELREHQAGAEHDRGVHVVAAGVGAVREGRAVRDVGLRVRNGQGVDVRAQGQDRPDPVPGAHVTDEARAGLQHPWAQAGFLQPGLDRRRGAELLVS
ncbi:hypothetical protein GCM10020254_35270 [Streptomyces goshikiensis]